MTDLGSAYFSNEPELIHVPLYYQFKKNKVNREVLVILSDEEAEKLLKDEETRDSVKILNTKWRDINWRDQNEMIKASLIQTPSGMQEVDWQQFRELRIGKALVQWDLTVNGTPVPLTPANIGKLPPELVIELYRKYESSVGMTAEEEGK